MTMQCAVFRQSQPQAIMTIPGSLKSELWIMSLMQCMRCRVRRSRGRLLMNSITIKLQTTQTRNNSHDFLFFLIDSIFVKYEEIKLIETPVDIFLTSFRGATSASFTSGFPEDIFKIVSCPIQQKTAFKRINKLLQKLNAKRERKCSPRTRYRQRTPVRFSQCRGVVSRNATFSIIE